MTRSWKHKIEITLPANAAGASIALADRLDLLPASFRNQGSWDQLDDAILWLRDDCTHTDDFNDILGFIYDWADEFRLWLLIDYQD